MDYYPNPFEENDLTTIQKVCDIYGGDPKKLGYLTIGGADVPGYAAPWSVKDSWQVRREAYENCKDEASRFYYMVWTLQFRHKTWLNTLSTDMNTITVTTLNKDDRESFLDQAYWI